jgi:hypothetical protein
MKSPVALVFDTRPRVAYQMHGVSVAIESDEATLMSRLQSRLGPFSLPAGEVTDSELRFEFRMTEAGGGIEGAPVPHRTVYQVADVEFRYDDAYDLLFVTCGQRLVGVCHGQRGVALFEVGADSVDDLELYSQTLFTVCLVELMKRHGRFSLHAAGIAVADKGILIAGPSGAGKSTLAIVLLQSLGERARFLGDDMLFLSSGAGGIRALGWPEPIDVGEWTQRKLPNLLARMHMTATAGRKGQIAAAEVAGAIPVLDTRPEVIVFPRVTEQATSSLIPMSPDEALLELAPNVLLTEATSSQAHLAALGFLARQCRCYRLEAGRDIESLPGLVLGLI